MGAVRILTIPLTQPRGVDADDEGMGYYDRYVDRLQVGEIQRRRAAAASRAERQAKRSAAAQRQGQQVRQV